MYASSPQKDQLPLVYIFNLLEDILPTFKSLNESNREQFFKEHTQFYNEVQIWSILSQFPNRKKYIFVFFCNIAEVYLKYVRQVMGMEDKQIVIVVPENSKENPSGSICEQLLLDEKALNELQKLQKFELLSFSMTDEFIKVSQALKDVAISPEVPSKQNWPRIKRSGTKPGIRELLESHKNENILLPRGKIFLQSPTSFEEALEYILKKLNEDKENIVIKTEKACSGFGIIIKNQQDLEGKSKQQIEHMLREQMSEQYWKKRDIVVQEYIDLDNSIGTPCIQIFLDNKCQIKWIFTMLTCDGHGLDGLQYGNQILKENQFNRINQIGTQLGKLYLKMGCQGYINIDCLISKKDIIYVCQSNLRRSGALYLYNVLKYLNNQVQFFAKTHYLCTQKAKQLGIQKLIQLLHHDDLNYTKKKNQGIILTTCSSFSQDFIQFITITKNREKAILLGLKFKALILQN